MTKSIELDELKKILRECVKKGGRYADNLKENGNEWLVDLLTDNSGEEYYRLIDYANTFEELMIIWGFINLIRGYEMSNTEKMKEDSKLMYIG